MTFAPIKDGGPGRECMSTVVENYKIPAEGIKKKPLNKRFPELVVIGLLLAASIAGLPYFMLSHGERLRSPLHQLLKPSGTFGQAIGVLALATFLFLWLYPIRKRVRRLENAGSMARWLEIHIIAGWSAPWLAAIHAGFRFEGLIGAGFFSMAIVSASGFFGRYLYVRIPRRASGVERSRAELNQVAEALISELSRSSGLAVERLRGDLQKVLPAGSAHGGLLSMVQEDLRSRTAARKLTSHWRKATGLSRDRSRLVGKLVRHQVALTQQTRWLNATRRWFKYWHIAHLPVAIAAMIAVIVHVGVAIALGVTWFW